MAVREIKTTLELDGEKQFKQAIAGANKQLRVMDSELRAAAAAFASTGDEQAFSATKARLLSERLEQQREIVRSLKSALDSVNDKFGEGSDEAQEWAIKLNNAQVKVAKLEKEMKGAGKRLDDVDDGFEDVGKEAKTFARNLDRYATDATEDAEKAMRGLEDQLGDLGSALDSIKDSAEFQVGVKLAEGAWDAVTGLFDYTEEAREYNRQLAMLEQNAANAKIDFSTAETEAFEAAAYIGDLDSALEGVNELLASGLDTTQFIQSIDLLTGAALRFPDTLKFESLADGLQETLATGQGAGQFAELLERLGVDMDEFNTGLAAAKTSGSEVDHVLTYLSQHGLADQKRAFDEANPGLVEAEQSTLRLQKAWISFGETIDPIMTDLKNFGSGVLEGFVERWGEPLKNIEENGLLGYMREEAKTGPHSQFMNNVSEFGWRGIFMGDTSKKIEWAQSGDLTDAIPDSWLETTLDKLFPKKGGGGGFFELPEPDTESFETTLENAAINAQTAGENIATAMAAGITAATDEAIAAANALAAGVQAELNKIVVPTFAFAGSAVAGGIAAQRQAINVNVNLNARRMGQTLTPYINQQMGMNQ